MTPIDDLPGLTSLEKNPLLDACEPDAPGTNRIDLIAQDEFCHDLYIPWQGRWLVFGLT